MHARGRLVSKREVAQSDSRMRACECVLCVLDLLVLSILKKCSYREVALALISSCIVKNKNAASGQSGKIGSLSSTNGNGNENITSK